MSWPFFQIQRTPAKGLDTGTSFSGQRRNQDASPNGRGGSILAFGVAVTQKEKSGPHDGRRLQAESAPAQPHRTPAGGEELAPLRGIEPSLGADQEGAGFPPGLPPVSRRRHFGVQEPAALRSG